MKAKHPYLAIAALLAVGALWFAWSNWHTHSSPQSSLEVVPTKPSDPPESGPMLRPPDPSRRFTDFTPEQRVQFARQGHGPGG